MVEIILIATDILGLRIGFPAAEEMKNIVLWKDVLSILTRDIQDALSREFQDGGGDGAVEGAH